MYIIIIIIIVVIYNAKRVGNRLAVKEGKKKNVAGADVV